MGDGVGVTLKGTGGSVKGIGHHWKRGGANGKRGGAMSLRDGTLKRGLATWEWGRGFREETGLSNRQCVL